MMHAQMVQLHLVLPLGTTTRAHHQVQSADSARCEVWKHDISAQIGAGERVSYHKRLCLHLWPFGFLRGDLQGPAVSTDSSLSTAVSLTSLPLVALWA